MGMTREERLRNLILDRYASVRQFSLHAGVPYSTVMTLLARGIGGASFDTVMQLCRELGLNPVELYI